MLDCVRQVFTGDVPFPNLRDGNVMMAVVMKDQRPPRPVEPATFHGLNDDMWAIIENCWKTQPAERFDAATVVDRLTLNFDMRTETGNVTPLYGGVPDHLQRTG